MKIKSKFIILVLLSTFTISFKVNAQEYSAINDPVFSENDSLAEDVTTPSTTSAKADSSESIPLISETGVKRFALKDFEQPLTEKISDEMSQKNISINDVSFKRENGIKSFTADQIKKITLNTRFEIGSVEIQDLNNKFSAILKPEKGNFLIDVTGSYTASKKVPVLARNINKDEKITQEDIELKLMPVDKINDKSLTEISDIVGKSATKSLSKGQLMSEDSLKNPIIIYKNGSVSAIYRNRNIEVKTLAIAQENGGIGDIIKLKNFDSGKIFKAIVMADGTVLVGGNTNDISLSTSATKVSDNLN